MMVTEMMGLLILLGAGLLLAVRWRTRKHRQPLEEQQDIEYATGQLRQELERTGSEITARLEGHVTRIERLLQDAERSRGELEERIAELRELMHMGSQQMDAMRGLRSEIAGARQLQRQLMELVTQGEASLAQITPAQPAIEPPGDATGQDFSQVLRQSIASGEAAYVGEPMVESQTPPAQEAAGIQFPTSSSIETRTLHDGEGVEQAEAVDADLDNGYEYGRSALPTSGSDPARARSLLMSGWTVEEVARETGMGRGAVELMQEMLRRQLGSNAREE